MLESYKQFVDAVLSLASTIVVLFAPIVLRELFIFLRLRSAETRDAVAVNSIDSYRWQVEAIVKTAAAAAAQLYHSKQIQDRLTWARDYTISQLEQRGMAALDVEAIIAAIEAEVAIQAERK